MDSPVVAPDLLRRRSLGGPAARSLLLTVLGEFVLDHAEPVWNAALVRALEAFGPDPGAAGPRPRAHLQLRGHRHQLGRPLADGHGARAGGPARPPPPGPHPARLGGVRLARPGPVDQPSAGTRAGAGGRRLGRARPARHALPGVHRCLCNSGAACSTGGLRRPDEYGPPVAQVPVPRPRPARAAAATRLERGAGARGLPLPPPALARARPRLVPVRHRLRPAWRSAQMLAIRTARSPDRKMPSKVPAPPMEATGAPSLRMRGRLSRSAPTKVRT